VKYFLLIFSTLCCFATPPPPIVVRTGRISLQWTASITPGVTRYNLRHSTNDLHWHTNYLVTGTAYTVTNIPAGSSNWFSVTAINADGVESDPSNVAEKPLANPPAPATGLQSIPLVVDVQSRTNGGVWASLRRYTNNVVFPTSEPEREFMTVLTVGRPTELIKP
jgi:fibronectin type 3 domain-containing protein